MLAKVPVLVAKLDLAFVGEKFMNLQSVVGKACFWCVAATMAVLTLLAVTWTVILVSN